MNSNCIVLGDAAIHNLLINLSKQELYRLLDNVADSLKDFSSEVGTYQPEAAIVNRPDGRRNLFRPFTSPMGTGVKFIVHPPPDIADEQGVTDPAERHKLEGIHGVIALCDQNGFPLGFLNAGEVTGYRTTMNAMILYVRRRKTDNIVVFGAGMQALWHIRLALGLRGDEVKRITVFNRSEDRRQLLLDQVTRENNERWKANVKFDSASPSDDEKLKEALANADVVFCTTGSKQPIFPAAYITDKNTNCYVSAVGSWQAHMVEIDPELLKFAANQKIDVGRVIVDDREGCQKDSGEVIQSGLSNDQIGELGLILSATASSTKSSDVNSPDNLSDGLLIYKSLGVSLTDLGASRAVLALAKEKGLGVSINEF